MTRRLRIAAVALFAASAAWADTAAVLVARGLVEVRLSASGEWAPAAGRRELGAGHEVRTRADATADIFFKDGTRITLSPNTQFLVERLDARQSSFKLSLGRLKAFAAGFFSSRMTLRTPTAVAAVRGTEFELSADSSGRTEVSVGEGHLEVSDNQGRQAVVTSEEIVSVGNEGLEPPRLIPLSDERALDAARPTAVAHELARDQTRSMMEELRNRELKANEAQLGKEIVDAFGRRVRLEEYLLRPAANEVKFLFLSFRANRFDWGHLIQRFQNNIPNDLSRLPAIAAQTFYSKTPPTNWLKYFEFYATNTIDSIREAITIGQPVLVNFGGYGAGLRYYPRTIDFTQVLSGPGVPGGSRTQFQLTQDYGQSASGQFTWRQKVIDNAGALNTLVHVSLNPANAADVAAGYTTIYPDDQVGNPAIDPVIFTGFPRGSTKADFQSTTRYRDGSVVSSEKILVDNRGQVIDFANPDPDTFNKEGNFNLEIVVRSSLFQGRDIDVVIAPEILSQKKDGTTPPDQIAPR